MACAALSDIDRFREQIGTYEPLNVLLMVQTITPTEVTKPSH